LNIGFFSIQVDTVTISGYPRAPPPPVIHRFSTGYPQVIHRGWVIHRLSTGYPQWLESLRRSQWILDG